jgi:3-hydroxybutyrate dehydrogenase
VPKAAAKAQAKENGMSLNGKVALVTGSTSGIGLAIARALAGAGFTKTVALEVARDGVTVNCISPGYVWTTLVENQIPDTMKARNLTREQVMNDVLLAAQPTKRFVTPEEVASLALYLCSDGAASITGANLSMDGGWTSQ